MKRVFCSKCLAVTKYMETGHDEQHRMFDLYFCEVCENYTRDFNLPEPNALVRESLSATPVQIRMFREGRVSED